jgi:HSP20 family protein
MRRSSFFEMQRALNRLFDEFYREIRMPGHSWGLTASRDLDLQPHLWPTVDISETGDQIQITAELPGVNNEDLEVSISGGQLTIRGEKKKQHEKSGQNFYHLERYYGSFHRNIPLPYEVESDQVDATFKGGILTVVLKKTKAAQERSKRIKVQ